MKKINLIEKYKSFLGKSVEEPELISFLKEKGVDQRSIDLLKIKPTSIEFNDVMLTFETVYFKYKNFDIESGKIILESFSLPLIGEGDDKKSRPYYQGELPYGFVLSDSRDSLKEKFGEVYEFEDYWDSWIIDDLEVVALYVRGDTTRFKSILISLIKLEDEAETRKVKKQKKVDVSVDILKNFEYPQIIMKLQQFEKQISRDNGNRYAGLFSLNLDNSKLLIDSYSKDSLFLNSLVQFAKADGTGSVYAFWLKGGEIDLAKVPIVVFGSEGGCHIVSQNIEELLQMLTYDKDISINWDRAIFFEKDEDFEATEYSEAYKSWLKENLNLNPIENPNEIVENAQLKFESEFQEWISQYVD